MVMAIKQGLVLADGSHTQTFAADIVDYIAAFRREVEVPSAAREVGVERPRPVTTVAASGVEIAVPAVASGRHENTRTIGGSKKTTLHTVLCCPCICRVLIQFQPI